MQDPARVEPKAAGARIGQILHLKACLGPVRTLHGLLEPCRSALLVAIRTVWFPVSPPPPFPTQPRGDLALPRVNQGIPASVGGRGSQTFEQEALEALATTIRAVIDEEAVVEKSAARMRHQACRPVL